MVQSTKTNLARPIQVFSYFLLETSEEFLLVQVGKKFHAFLHESLHLEVINTLERFLHKFLKYFATKCDLAISNP